MADTGFPPYAEASAQAQARLSTRDRILAALSGLGAIQRGATPGQAFLQGLGGSARAISSSEQAAQNYAQKQIEAQRAAEDQAMNTKYKEAMIKSLEKPDKPVKLEPYQLPQDQQDAIIKFEARRARALADANPKPAKEPQLVQVAGPDGSTMWVDKNTAVGKTAKSGVTAKPPTAVEKAKAGVLRAASAAEGNIQTQEDRLGKMNLFDQLRLSKAPNFAQSPENQKYIQAGNWWIENILRAVSGAAIGITEYPKYREIYFMQPGDSKEVTDQKRASRQVILENYRAMAGGAAEGIPAVPGGGGGADPLGIR